MALEDFDGFGVVFFSAFALVVDSVAFDFDPGELFAGVDEPVDFFLGGYFGVVDFLVVEPVLFGVFIFFEFVVDVCVPAGDAADGSADEDVTGDDAEELPAVVGGVFDEWEGAEARHEDDGGYECESGHEAVVVINGGGDGDNSEDGE